MIAASKSYRHDWSICDRFPVLALCLVLVHHIGAISPSRASVDELQQASERLFAALQLVEVACPSDTAIDRPSRNLLCGSTDLKAREFMRKADELLAEPSRIGVSAVVKNKWDKFDGIFRQYYEIGERFIGLAYYPKSKTVVIQYPEYFAVCGAPGAPALQPDESPAGVEPPVLEPKTKTSPLYPEIGRLGRVQGKMVLQAVVGTDGVLKDVCVVRGMGKHLGFEYAAVQAVKSWRYAPARRNGEPVEFVMKIVVEFTLK